MDIVSSVQTEATRKRLGRAGSLLICLILLTASLFGPRLSNGPLGLLPLVLVLIVLCSALFLHGRFMILARRQQHETEDILRVTEREFQSIFDAALDGILILDHEANCLEANPAALVLFGALRNELVGHSIWTFPSVCDPERSSRKFVDADDQHGEVHFIREDGEEIFAEYTVSTNYLPGRRVAVFRDISARKRAEAALRESEERFQQMAASIREIYWLLDAGTKRLIYVNQAYETITGRSLESLRDNPGSYQEALHPEDRLRVLTRLNDATTTGELDEEFRIVRPDNQIRWVSVRGFPIRDSAGVIRKLVGISQDVTARKSAEEKMAKSLVTTESSRAEADAFRKITLALTQNLKMDCVLDTLLESLLQLVPCESARILLVEADTRIFVEREVQLPDSGRRPPKCPDTLDARDIPFLMRVLTTRNSVLVPDTGEEPQWSDFRGHAHLRSWLCVPLIANQQVLGLLSLGGTNAHTFTQDHLRLAKSLAIPAAVAIQNARLYERAEIYGIELQQRLAELARIERALHQAEQS
jgi:PAS domain S-box-containing protein